jgi:Flp pilus assembly protein TadG
MRPVRRLSRERGAAIVETLFAILFLLFVMFGIVELARAWFTQQLATAAVREAVRFTAVIPQTPGMSLSDVEAQISTDGVARINAVLAAGGVTTSQLVAPTPTVVLQDVGIPGSTDKQVVASVTVRFSTVFPLLLPNLGTLNIPQSAAMRWEGSGT